MRAGRSTKPARSATPSLSNLASFGARWMQRSREAQERGEVAGKGQPSNVPDGNIKPATVEDIGLTRKQVYEARIIRDAERVEPGIVRRTLNGAKSKDTAMFRPGTSCRPEKVRDADLLPTASDLGLTKQKIRPESLSIQGPSGRPEGCPTWAP